MTMLCDFVLFCVLNYDLLKEKKKKKINLTTGNKR